MKYKKYSGNKITKEILDSIQIGDMVKYNDFKLEFKVIVVSEDFFIAEAYDYKLGMMLYSIYEKIQHRKNFLSDCYLIDISGKNLIAISKFFKATNL